MLKAKLISSLEKVFLDGNYDDYPVLTNISLLKNELLSLQLTVTDDDASAPHRRFVNVMAAGVFAEYASFRSVCQIPSAMPAFPHAYDDDYLRTKPGLFPDLLDKMQMNGSVPCAKNQLNTVWLDIDTKGEVTGKQTLEIVLTDGESQTKLTLDVNVINASLPEQDLIVTQWFHCDCLATYYKIPVFSERHWEIIENFVRTSVKNGNNMLLTPLFTPPIDTLVGGERPTVQLVKVFKNGDSYTFDFSLVERWLDVCDRCGVKYYEIAHFFTQWGAAHAPKIMALTNEGEQRIFGWETDAAGEEYSRFLHAFIPEFLGFMKARGVDKRCYFHISDEPDVSHLEQYLKSKSVVEDMLKGYPIMDAMSDYEYYKQGIARLPIPSSDRIEQFIENGVSPLWTYYCCGQCQNVSNRFFAMSGARTRYIGVQMYKYNVEGFLQWGYNFYYNQYSCDEINPYVDSTGNYFVPSGDAYSVYPSNDGTALESVRINHFRQGIDDIRAMQLAEKLSSRENVICAIEEITGKIVFGKCISDSKTAHAIRERINGIIESNI